MKEPNSWKNAAAVWAPVYYCDHSHREGDDNDDPRREDPIIINVVELFWNFFPAPFPQSFLPRTDDNTYSHRSSLRKFVFFSLLPQTLCCLFTVLLYDVVGEGERRARIGSSTAEETTEKKMTKRFKLSVNGSSSQKGKLKSFFFHLCQPSSASQVRPAKFGQPFFFWQGKKKKTLLALLVGLAFFRSPTFPITTVEEEERCEWVLRFIIRRAGNQKKKVPEKEGPKLNGRCFAGIFSGSQTLPISFGRKLEGLEAASSPNSHLECDSDISSGNIHQQSDCGGATTAGGVLQETSDQNIHSPTVPVKAPSSGRFNSLRKWFRPWRWMKSKRGSGGDGHQASLGKENSRRKSAEMEDVAVGSSEGIHTANAYGTEDLFPGSRMTISSTGEGNLLIMPGMFWVWSLFVRLIDRLIDWLIGMIRRLIDWSLWIFSVTPFVVSLNCVL